MMQHGTTNTSDKVLRTVILHTLRHATFGKGGIGPIVEPQNWGAFTNKLMGVQHAFVNRHAEGEYPEYEKIVRGNYEKHVRRMISTIEDDAGWASFKAYIRNLG